MSASIGLLLEYIRTIRENQLILQNISKYINECNTNATTLLSLYFNPIYDNVDSTSSTQEDTTQTYSDTPRRRTVRSTSNERRNINRDTVSSRNRSTRPTSGRRRNVISPNINNRGGQATTNRGVSRSIPSLNYDNTTTNEQIISRWNNFIEDIVSEIIENTNILTSRNNRTSQSTTIPQPTQPTYQRPTIHQRIYPAPPRNVMPPPPPPPPSNVPPPPPLTTSSISHPVSPRNLTETNDNMSEEPMQPRPRSLSGVISPPTNISSPDTTAGPILPQPPTLQRHNAESVTPPLRTLSTLTRLLNTSQTNNPPATLRSNNALLTRNLNTSSSNSLANNMSRYSTGALDAEVLRELHNITTGNRENNSTIDNIIRRRYPRRTNIIQPLNSNRTTNITTTEEEENGSAYTLMRATYYSTPRQPNNEPEDTFDAPIRIRPSPYQILNSTETLKYSELINGDNSGNLPPHCPIDLNPFENDDDIMRIKPCQHIFKELNLRNHFLYSPRCPICRYDIRNYDAEEEKEDGEISNSDVDDNRMYGTTVSV